MFNRPRKTIHPGPRDPIPTGSERARSMKHISLHEREEHSGTAVQSPYFLRGDMSPERVPLLTENIREVSEVINGRTNSVGLSRSILVHPLALRELLIRCLTDCQKITETGQVITKRLKHF